jgi:head-tail adaptor
MARRLTAMEPGERDRQITVQRLTETTGTSGFPVEDWTTLTPLTFFASRQDLTSSERVRMDQLSAKADARWEIPYHADMDPDLLSIPKVRRVIYKSRVHDITGASIIGRNEGIELLTLQKAG